MLYDAADKSSIEKYAKRLLNKSLCDMFPEVASISKKGKGGLGQKVEEFYFGYKPNSYSQPDFPQAGVELKTCPLKKTSKGLRAKERVVLNIIDFMQEHKSTFETSSFWKKNKLLLMMFFLYLNDVPDVEFIFKYIFLWQYPNKDLEIIKNDWATIVSKIRDGRAHELSEGDTLYLGACTKGSKGGLSSNFREQPFNTIKAPQRAYSLKPSYVNSIIEQYTNSADYESLVSSDDLKIKSFEELIIDKFKVFYGKSINEIAENLGVSIGVSKDKVATLCRAVLGVSNKRKIEEFEKADIQMKTIPINSLGTPIEEMSFKQISYKEILNEEWESSYWHDALTKRFFFVVFEEINGVSILRKAMFWTMPYEDLQLAKKFWEDTRFKIANDDFDNFIKSSDGLPCFVRTKGRNSNDVMETPSGRMERKRGYWISRSYIKKIIS
ncbi:Sau3AI family type II restriction endonuclease [Pseudaquidulcibacter saccharophilus]|uniref:Sau3AI family type II restriction endonuclease n=1 Tax=Pseudaquidulcibacter saccharophilus TaxID=2831900 RepID=UPI0023D90A2C|nr:Sau3AI family type II restriction endonuclease [Pseudaquidulcibacter saccharophilus]